MLMLVDDQDEVPNYEPSANKTSLNKLSSKLKLFKK